MGSRKEADPGSCVGLPRSKAQDTRPRDFGRECGLQMKRRWSVAEDAELMSLWPLNLSAREISAKIGRPFGSVRKRSIRLKLPRRPKIDGLQGGRPEGTTMTHCHRGHPLTEENLYVRTRNGRIERQCKICLWSANGDARAASKRASPAKKAGMK